MKTTFMTSIPNMHHIAPPGQAAPPRNIGPMRRFCGLAIAAIGLSATITSAHAADFVAATGGTTNTYQVGATIYTVHTFTSSGTFTVTSASGGTVNYLVIAGGGGGGSGTGGGGGAGGFLESTATVTGGSTAYTVTVGTGGPGGTANTAGSAGWGSTGNPSSFDVFATASGGGGGAPNSTTLAANGNPGGSGGGGSWGTPGAASTGGAATSGQGNAGGACLAWGGPYVGGGGGGAGAVGVAGNKQNPGAAGGAGKASTITGTSTTYAGGGGGGAFNSPGGTGGLGGTTGKGGNGGGGATAGAANTGSGGGGQGGNKTGAGAGGSGVVIISYASGTSPNPTSTSATLAVLENTATALTESNFGYADPNSSALANVQITTLPALGTLKLSGTPVTLNQIVAVADIPNLTYQSAPPTFGTGAAYTTIGIKVQNAASLWSAAALMTVNVTPAIIVQNPSFETIGASLGGPWATADAIWNPNLTYAQTNDNNRFATRTDAGVWYANLTDPGNTFYQNLATTVNSGETLAVTFYVGRELGQVGGVMAATFKVGTTSYTQNFDTTGLTAGTWQSYTLSQTIANTGNLTLQFSRVSGRPWLDNISNVSVTPAAPPNGEPTSTDATLTAVEDTEIALAAENFGYADPNDPQSPLKAVRITSLPDKGTLKHNTNTVLIGDLPLEVAVADIGTLTYQSAVYGYGTPYTTIGIKVKSANDLWSLADSLMTVNVTHVNHPPTSTGGSVSLKANTVKWFAASNFQFSDVDAGDTLRAIKVTSLPGKGILMLNGTEITEVPTDEISIGFLTYTPTPDYSGTDSFDFKVSDGTAFSTSAATMAITITVNQVPTSTGGSVILHTNTVKTFAAANFPFADGDVGDTLQAIKVTSLPAGTLTLDGTPITSAPSADIPVADIGTLTYTPVTGYNGADSFEFQLSDGIDFSADATMAITITTDILVSNGSFETPGALLGGPWATFGSPWSIINSPGPYQQIKAVAGGFFASAPDGLWVGLINGDDCPITAPLTQNLGVSVAAGDTLTVTFQSGRQLNAVGGTGVAYFDVDGTKYTTPFDTTMLTAGAWQLTTMTQTITNSGNLTLGFYGTTGHAVNAWIDNISNVSVTTGPVSGSYSAWATTNGAGTQTMDQDHDNDGVPNGVEYFLGGSGNTTGFTALPGVVDTAGTLSVTWTKAASGYAGAYGTDYVVQTSTTLATGDWTNEPSTGGGVTLSGNHVIYTFPSAGPLKFARLKVMGAP